MECGNIILLVIYVVSMIVGVVVAINMIREAKTKDRLTDGWMLLIVSFTPGILLIGMMVLFGLFIFAIIEGPTYILSKIKKIEE